MTIHEVTAGALAASALVSQGQALSASADFDSSGADRAAIEHLLSDYTTAVSTKNERLFETLLLNREIPFGSVAEAGLSTSESETRGYEGFRKGVFYGAPFNQTFKDIHIKQDGGLANVTLVFVNTRSDQVSWGWKSLQLLKIGGHWKIASEFYSVHR